MKLKNKDKEKNEQKNSANNKKSKKHNKLLILIIVILVILLSCMVIAKIFLDNKLNKINFKELNITDSNDMGISKNEQKENKIKNIALIGTDSQNNSYDDFARADCILIISINYETNKVNLFSIYRDTLVQMDLYDKTRIDKINHSFYGGIETTIKTINTNFDLNISEYVLVNFKVVEDLVDAVNGVDINITSDELKYINNYIKNNMKVTGVSSDLVTKEGMQTLNGVQALAYSRIRYTEGGDFKRTERMRTVVQKVFQKLKEKNVIEINEILNKILPEIQTNVTKNEIIGLMTKAFNFEINETFGFPYNVVSTKLDLKDYYEGTTKGVDYYDIPTSLPDDVIKLHKEILGEENYSLSENVSSIFEKIKEVANLN